MGPIFIIGEHNAKFVSYFVLGVWGKGRDGYCTIVFLYSKCTDILKCTLLLL